LLPAPVTVIVFLVFAVPGSNGERAGFADGGAVGAGVGAGGTGVGTGVGCGSEFLSTILNISPSRSTM